MAKQKGRTLLVKLDTKTGESAPDFSVLCALNAKTLTINNEEIDVTSADCDDPGGRLWTEVLDGVSRLSFTGNGTSKKDTAEVRLAAVSLSAPPVIRAQVVVPNFGLFECDLFVQSFELGGEMTGGVTFSLTAASTGKVDFTPEADT
ncbi:phage major tail protein, TP901-1 family [Rhodobacteraceae bacterium]|nr:phage major tail protein, TP901-1 family [Paracoccaceae bacterium]